MSWAKLPSSMAKLATFKSTALSSTSTPKTPIFSKIVSIPSFPSSTIKAQFLPIKKPFLFLAPFWKMKLFSKLTPKTISPSSKWSPVPISTPSPKPPTTSKLPKTLLSISTTPPSMSAFSTTLPTLPIPKPRI